MQTVIKRYTVQRCTEPPAIDAQAGALPEAWKDAEVGQVSNWHARGSEHRPGVEFRVLYDSQALYVRFDVRDRYVRSVQTEPQSSVCGDSCVEFFVEPKQGRGYLNFEINAGGALLLYHILDPRHAPQGGFTKWSQVEPAWLQTVAIAHSLPAVVEPEIAEPTAWALVYRVPLTLFTAHTGVEGIVHGDVWRANFYKCADRTSHPHWGSWNDIGEVLNFHKPECFGDLAFA
ncbi:MAG: carbohydrate-binding family 9-like protein [Kiritimatiellae bacterium]|nr:carbohydrate-binding family 9-like protein [Kiritimatiellia bacterium]